MKNYLPYISAALLVGHALYSVTHEISLAHAIIFTSLAGLFAYNQYLLSRSTPKLEDEIAKLKSELGQEIEKQKESHEKKFSELEGEMTKLSLTAVRSPSSSTKAPDKKRQYQF